MPFDSLATPDISGLNWNNDGKGGVRLYRNGTVVASTGDLNVPRGKSTTLYFSVMFTPVRPLNLSKHFGERYDCPLCLSTVLAVVMMMVMMMIMLL